MTFMQCQRCNGQMVNVRLSDFFMMINALKCVQCGEIIDKLILENRRLSKNRAPEELRLPKGPHHK